MAIGPSHRCRPSPCHTRRPQAARLDREQRSGRFSAAPASRGRNDSATCEASVNSMKVGRRARPPASQERARATARLWPAREMGHDCLLL